MKRIRLKRGAVAVKKNRLPYIYRVSIAMFNTDYPEFEKSFIKHGGTAHMADHLWKKWKIEHHDDFLGMVGTLDFENMRIMEKVVDDLVAKKTKGWAR